jgi:vancomycin aglycone glucosyltransferase
MRPPFHLHPRFRFVGFCRWQSAESDALDRELREFTHGERVPVITVGSMVYHEAEVWMRRLAAAWPRDRKLVVQRGWSGFGSLNDCPHIRVIGPVSHRQLFRQASVVIHHGGAGTTASVLASGRPHIVVPHIADQSFFAHEVHRLGCGVRLAKRHWPEELAAAVARVESDASVIEAAGRAADCMAAENGPGEAVREMELFTCCRTARAETVS